MIKALQARGSAMRKGASWRAWLSKGRCRRIGFHTVLTPSGAMPTPGNWLPKRCPRGLDAADADLAWKAHGIGRVRKCLRTIVQETQGPAAGGAEIRRQQAAPHRTCGTKLHNSGSQLISAQPDTTFSRCGTSRRKEARDDRVGTVKSWTAREDRQKRRRTLSGLDPALAEQTLASNRFSTSDRSEPSRPQARRWQLKEVTWHLGR